MENLSKNARLIRQIGELLDGNGLTELDLGDLDELDEPTSIVHSDNDGNISDDPVTKVFRDGDELFVEVENPDGADPLRVYRDEFDTHTEWLEGIRDNVAQVLRRMGLAVPDSLDDPFEGLTVRLQEWQRDARALLIRTLREHGGRISFIPRTPFEEYPVTAFLSGQHDDPRIDISDLYLEGDTILADGYTVGETTHEHRKGFHIFNEHLSVAFSFVKHTIHP